MAHIQIRFDSEEMEWPQLEASISALRQYRPIPDIKMSLSIKGILSDRALEVIVAEVERAEGAKCQITVHGTFPEGNQLRLFGPPETESNDPQWKLPAETENEEAL